MAFGDPHYGQIRGKCFSWFLRNYPCHRWSNVHGVGVVDNVWHFVGTHHPDVVEAIVAEVAS